MTLLLYVSPLIFSTALGLFLTFFILRIRYVPGSRPLGALILAAALWSAGYALEFLVPSFSGKLFWAKFQYLGIATIPVAWLLFCHRYLESHEWPRSLRNRLLLVLIPVVTLILVWTNEAHHLIWGETRLQGTGPIQVLAIHHGPWFWVFWAYSYVLLAFGSVRLVRTLLGSARLQNWQIRLALAAVAMPWLGNLLYAVGLSPIRYLDLTPFIFAVAGLILSMSLFRFQLANIPPIAHEQIFDGQEDQLVVLDSREFVVDLNPAAHAKARILGKAAIGRPLDQVFPELAPWAGQAGNADEFHAEIVQGEVPDERFYDLHISPLPHASTRPFGRLIVLHEITQYIREQERLEQARAQLQGIVSDRTNELRLTVERLQFELAQRTLAEKRFEEVIESAPDAMLLVDQRGVIRLVNAQAERLFGYARSELLGKPIDGLMPPRQRKRHDGYITEFFARPVVRHVQSPLNYTAQRKDGSRFPAEISMGPVNTADGIWAACSVRDITERRKAEEEQNRLLEELGQSQAEQQALTARLQEVQEAERRQIAEELHDRIGQNLTGINLNLQIIENVLGPAGDPAVLGRLVDSQKLIEQTTRDVRDVMADLHPPLLDEYGLVSTLQWYSAQFSKRTGIVARLSGSEFVPRLPPNVELVLFRMVQEALTNVAKHARARKVAITVESSEGAACLHIEDDGRGFDIKPLKPGSDQPHWGMMTMQQRASSIGALLEIRSAPGRGTHLSISLRRSNDVD